MFGYFENRFNTPLNTWQEMLFQASPYAADTQDYDSRGAWLDMQLGLMQQHANGHLDDTYKKPNHPTFSNESVYANDAWRGGSWVRDAYGRYGFVPDAASYYSVPELQEYFRRVEPLSVLYAL